MRRPRASVLASALGLPWLAWPAGADGLDAFLREAASADIVILGELHDNPDHHRRQAEIVAILAPDALVFEMIDQAAEAEVNRMRDAGASRAEIAAAIGWDDSGWPDFDYYAQIMEAAPEARIFGAGQPIEDVRRAMVEGAAAPFGPDADIFGLDQPLPEAEQAAREAQMFAAHCEAVPEEILPGMVEAQRFRDAGIADAARWARTLTAEGQVVVIAGNGHADRLWGVPAILERAAPSVAVLSLGQFEDEPDADMRARFDHVAISPAPARDDPCAVFDN